MGRDGNTTTCIYLGGRRLYRDALCTALSRAGLRLVPAATLREALDHVEAEGADGVLLDVLGLDEPRAAELVAGLLRARPDLKVAGISDVCSPALPAALIRAGASGFLSKETPLRELRDALDRVLGGDLVVDPAVARSLFGYLDPDVAQASTRAGGPPRLTGAEQRVLSLAAEGRLNKQIARELGLSPLTVKNHLARARARLAVSTTAQAVAVAMRAGILA